MVSGVDEIQKYAEVDEAIQRCINKFLPGPLTMLLKAKENVPSWVTCNTGIIGIRIPSNNEALTLLKTVGKPLLVPSANKAGEKPAMNSKEVKDIFLDELDYIVEGSAIGGLPTTIVDFTTNNIKILREGPISLNEILDAMKE